MTPPMEPTTKLKSITIRQLRIKNDQVGLTIFERFPALERCRLTDESNIQFVAGANLAAIANADFLQQFEHIQSPQG